MQKILGNENTRVHFLIIVVVVVLANLYSVFGLDILIQDDNSRYLTAVNGEYRYDYPWRSFLGLRSDLMWFLISVLTYSAALARLLVLLVFMVPLSLLFYVFNRQVLELPVWVALTSAVIVQMIPSMYQIPSFLDGSYPAYGLLAFMTTLLLADRFLKSPSQQVSVFAAWFLAWVLANDLMVEMGILLYPALLYFLYISGGSFRKKLALYLSSLLIILVRLFLYIETYGHPTNSVSSNNPEEIVNRVGRTIEWWLPFPVSPSFSLILLVSVLCVLAAVYFRNNLRRALSGIYFRALVFYGLWFAATCIPFWFLSKNFTPRYFYIAYFAVTTMVMILLYRLWIERARKDGALAITAMLVLFAGFGLSRHWNTESAFKQLNSEKQQVQALLDNESIEAGLQIALINNSYTTGGFYLWSSGYLEYAFQEPALRGLMGPEFSFYDPFDMDSCGVQRPMSCLDPDRKLIAYRFETRMTYFLQWKLAGKQDSPWTLLHSDETNSLQAIASGVGKESYTRFLAQAQIDSEDVLWGRLTH